MNAPIPISAMASRIPPAPVLAILARYRRADIEAFIAIAIDLLDLADGEPDRELAGDETDGNAAEDDECAYFATLGNGPGCGVADDDICDGSA
jgi:hypothetical protein